MLRISWSTYVLLNRNLIKAKHFLSPDHWGNSYILDEVTLKKKSKQPKFVKKLSTDPYAYYSREENRKSDGIQGWANNQFYRMICGKSITGSDHKWRIMSSNMVYYCYYCWPHIQQVGLSRLRNTSTDAPTYTTPTPIWSWGLSRSKFFWPAHSGPFSMTSWQKKRWTTW